VWSGYSAPTRSAARALMLAAVAGCTSHGPWRQLDEATPWIAPGAPARLFIRTVEPGPFIVAGANAERVWRDANGRDYPLNRCQDAIEAFIVKTGMLAQWPESGSSNNFGPERLAAFRFTVVSVNPTAVLMTPFDFGPPVGRAESDILEPIWETRCLGNQRMLNYLECGTSAGYAPGMLWFSPDLQLTPAPIPWRDRRAELAMGEHGVLVLTQDGATVRTSRQ
jgi:hypothetical protein